MPTEEQVTSFIDKLQPAVEQAANALGVAATELWSLGIAKQYIDGILSATYALIALAIMLVWAFKGIPFCVSGFKKADSYMKDGWIMGGSVVSALIFTIGGIVFFDELSGALYHLILPEWTLIQEILTYIK